MAIYRDRRKMHPSLSKAFDSVQKSGFQVRYSGIYACIECGVEIALSAGRLVPERPNNPHAPGCPDGGWRLVVATSAPVERPATSESKDS
ncbi:conserved hypothetical protein [Burkholderiales bacterium 8X]|nr:conserved hypothetical protein [Burkholderiales bacterium 8X]